MTHELKTHPGEFQAVLDGIMPFQLRRNDRDFRVGDQLLLREWIPDHQVVGAPIPPLPKPMPNRFIRGYTGRKITVRVDYIMDSYQIDEIAGIMEAIGAPPIIMSISHVN